MIETIAAVNQAVNSFIWGIPAMVCIIGVGLLLSVRTGFLQIRKFPYAIQPIIIIITIDLFKLNRISLISCRDTLVIIIFFNSHNH